MTTPAEARARLTILLTAVLVAGLLLGFSLGMIVAGWIQP